MKELFDRHADKLTPMERQVLWQTLSDAGAGESRSRIRGLLATAASALAAGVITFAILHREAVAPSRVGATGTAENSPSASLNSSEAPRGVPGAESGRARQPGWSAGSPEASKSLADAGLSSPRHPAARPAKTVVSPIPIGTAAQTLPESVAQIVVVPAPEEQHTGSPLAAPVPPASSLHVGQVTGVITDSQKRPLGFANVFIPTLRIGALSDADGRFTLLRVPAGRETVRVNFLGYKTRELTVECVAESTVALAVTLDDIAIAEEMAVEVSAPRRLVTNSSTTKQSITAEKLRRLPVDNLSRAVQRRAGVVAQGNELHIRGGRSDEVRFQTNGVPSLGRLPPPVVPTTGGTALPNNEAYDSMFFRNYGVNPFIATDEDSLSTFAADVDAASYTITRSYLELGQLPPADAVRVEEFINFFPQGYPKFENDDFKILVDGAPSPFRPGYQLMRIGIKGREISERNRKPAELTFVIDVSGSMDREDRLGLVKQALRLLVDRLHDDDRIGIVIFGSEASVLLEPTPLGASTVAAREGYPYSDILREAPRRARSGGRQRILDAIDRLQPGGSTNAGQGLLLGYEMARRGFRPEAINRIVLCSDGVANVGLTDTESILARVRSEADKAIQLSTIGLGMGNYNDVLLEQLADKGDGNHYYVDDLREARRVFVDNLSGTLQTIANDAKIQVEFHPSRVLRYRLLGFENRDVADRDFRNNKVDAGEIGAGHEVTALYEVKLSPYADSEPIASVRLRYARPEHDHAGTPEVREIAATIRSNELSDKFEDASPRFRLDAAVAQFAEILRGSYWAKETNPSDVLSVARSAAHDLREETATELVSLVEKAARLKKSIKPKEPKTEP